MIQFNNYPSNEPHRLKTYLSHARNLLFINEKDLAKITINSMDLIKYPRFQLILARLIAYNIVEESFAEAIFEQMIKSAETPDNFFLTELLSCLPKTISYFENVNYKIDLNELHKICSHQTPDKIRDKLKRKDDSILVYQPRKSGFFSIIENIIAAEFCAENSGIRFSLVPENYWWPYAVSFTDLFPNIWSFVESGSNIGTKKIIDFERMRQAVKHLNLDKLSTFTAFKLERYKEIRQILHNQYADRLKLAYPYYYYHRVGDKIIHETVAVPTSIAATTLARAVNDEKVGIVSDSYKDAAEICSQSKNFVNCTHESFSGHFIEQSVTKADVDAIVTNYLLLSSSRSFLSCPSSNLVNAAHWSSVQSTPKCGMTLNPTPRYFLI